MKPEGAGTAAGAPGLPAGFPTALPSGLATAFPSGMPSGFPTVMPTSITIPSSIPIPQFPQPAPTTTGTAK